MRTLAWDRDSVIEQIRDRIWLYLSAASDTEQLALEAGALLDLRQTDVLAIARALFLLSDEVEVFLEDAHELLRRLPTSSAQVEEVSAERIRGPIRWQATLLARRSAGMPNLYVTAPSERAFDTPENELLVFLLEAIVLLGQQLGWSRGSGPASQLVDDRVSTATRLLSHRMLTSVDRSFPNPRRLARVRTGRHRRRFESALALFGVYESLIDQLHRPSLMDAIERGGLVVQSNDKLFEIFVLFRVLDWLREQGWTLPPPRVFPGGLSIPAKREGQELDVRYQVLPKHLSGLSRYGQTLFTHGLGRSEPRPDLTLTTHDGEDVRTLLVELKMGTRRSSQESTREALRDLLAYEASYAQVLNRQSGIVGLGIVWGEGLEPQPGRIALSTVDTFGRGLQAFLEPQRSS